MGNHLDPFPPYYGKHMAHRLSEKEKKLAFPENENIGLLWSKVPMFCLESTDVSFKEVRCF